MSERGAVSLPKRDPRKGQYEKNKCHKKLRRLVGEALTDFNMLSNGDKVMVCLSGGKDSYTLLDMMLSFQQHAPIQFDIVAVNLDQKQPGFPEHVLPKYLSEVGVPFDIIEQDTYSIVKELTPEGKTTCPVCSRLRRGILYNHAGRNANRRSRFNQAQPKKRCRTTTSATSWRLSYGPSQQLHHLDRSRLQQGRCGVMVRAGTGTTQPALGSEKSGGRARLVVADLVINCSNARSVRTRALNHWSKR